MKVDVTSVKNAVIVVACRYMNKQIDIKIGDVFGDWTVISDKPRQGAFRLLYVECQCKCGRKALKSISAIKKGTVKSCKSCCRNIIYKNSFSIRYFNNIKRRAINKNLEFDLDYEYLYELIEKQEWKCALSNLPISFKIQWKGEINQSASLDRIDNNKGYTKGNVQWVHKDINFMKGSFSQLKFLNLCKLISDNSKCM